MLADEDIEMAITSEPARPTRHAGTFGIGDDPIVQPEDIDNHNEATAAQRQRAPKVLSTDGQTGLRNVDLARMNDEYLHNMVVALKQKRNNKIPTQARKNAAYWVFGLGIGCVGAGVGTAQFTHPLRFFSGDELYDTLVPQKSSRKRPLDDESESDARRVRAREEDDAHLGRLELVDDNNFWSQVQLYNQRPAPEALTSPGC